MPQCWPGTAAGGWRRYEWVLRGNGTVAHSNGTGGARCAPLADFVHAEIKRCGAKARSPVPGASPTNLPSCSLRDDRLLRSSLANASLLMVGDSTSAQLLLHACEAYGSRPKSFIEHWPNVSTSKYRHRLRSLDNHHCTLPGNFRLGSFSHYGATGPPYWVFAYPLAPWLSNHTVGMVRHDLPKFRRVTPRHADPTLVVASSGFWDIASWWAHESNFSRHWHVGPNHTARYVAGVRRLVREVRRAFPTSLVVWRLMHPGSKHSITPKVVHDLNSAVRASAPAWRLPLLDAETVVSSLSPSAQPSMGRGPPYGTADGRHLHGFINLALLNLLFNLASRARDGQVPYGRWHAATLQLRANRTALIGGANLLHRTNRTARAAILGGTHRANRTAPTGAHRANRTARAAVLGGAHRANRSASLAAPLNRRQAQPAANRSRELVSRRGGGGVRHAAGAAALPLTNHSAAPSKARREERKGAPRAAG